MKKAIRIAICSTLMIAFGTMVFAQSSTASSSSTSSGSGKELTIEELYLQNAAIRLIRDQAVAPQRAMKLLALDNIQSMMDDGKIAHGDQNTELILDYLAGEGTTHIVREDGRVVNYFPEVRREAVNLLGRLGGAAAHQSLMHVLLTDNEPMVLSEAVYALGKIGTNKDNQTSQAIASVIIRRDAVKPDDNFAFASLLALEKIAAANKGLNDPAAVEAIITISQGNYIRPVRLKADQLLNELKQY